VYVCVLVKVSRDAVGLIVVKRPALREILTTILLPVLVYTSTYDAGLVTDIVNVPEDVDPVAISAYEESKNLTVAIVEEIQETVYVPAAKLCGILYSVFADTAVTL
jgi:hypothetical protein